MTGEQLPLFNDGRRTPRPAVPPPMPRAVTYRALRSREWCDDCVSHTHAVGFTSSPFPRQQRWKRIDIDGTEKRLCDAHRRDRQASE